MSPAQPRLADAQPRDPGWLLAITWVGVAWDRRCIADQHNGAHERKTAQGHHGPDHRLHLPALQQRMHVVGDGAMDAGFAAPAFRVDGVFTRLPRRRRCEGDVFCVDIESDE